MRADTVEQVRTDGLEAVTAPIPLGELYQAIECLSRCLGGALRRAQQST